MLRYMVKKLTFALFRLDFVIRLTGGTDDDAQLVMRLARVLRLTTQASVARWASGNNNFFGSHCVAYSTTSTFAGRSGISTCMHFVEVAANTVQRWHPRSASIWGVFLIPLTECKL
jgi:hypothetical protein